MLVAALERLNEDGGLPPPHFDGAVGYLGA